jgi:uncharacterized membrane protein
MEIVEDNRSFDKTLGIVAYMTLIGWVVALVLNNEKKGAEKQFAAFHLRHMLGLMIVAFCTWIIQVPLAFIPIIGWLVSFLLSVGLLALWIVCVIGAASGEKKEIPVFSGMVASLFKDLFEK